MGMGGYGSTKLRPELKLYIRGYSKNDQSIDTYNNVLIITYTYLYV